jgi:hypothetical protein
MALVGDAYDYLAVEALQFLSPALLKRLLGFPRFRLWAYGTMSREAKETGSRHDDQRTQVPGRLLLARAIDAGRECVKRKDAKSFAKAPPARPHAGPPFESVVDAKQAFTTDPSRRD